MASSGYILNGVYHRREKVPLKDMVKVQQTLYKQSDHARQRFDHAAEILQPYTYDGKPNPKFIEASPDAAAEYGFLPRTEPEGPRVSDTPVPGQEGYGGSIPWDYQLQQRSNPNQTR